MGKDPPLAHRELDHTQGYLAAIVESSDDAIISKDLDGIVRSFNAAAERLFGYAQEEIVGRPITLLLPPDRIHEESEILSKLRRGEPIEHFETVRQAKDGRRIEISLSVSPVRNGSGAIIGAAKIVRDVTERNRAARALAAQQEWFRVTLSSIGDAVIATDPEGRVSFMNPEAEKLTGWSNEEAGGKPLVEIFHIVNEKTRAPVENPADMVIRQGVTVGLANHTVLISRQGTERPIDDSAAPIRDAAGRVIGVVLVFRDVSERRRRELERQTTAREREDLLLSERRARAEAERATRVKDDFVAMVSHELRTPLSAILGWTNVLQSKSGDEGVVRHGLEIIARNARAQAQLVSDLLDVSRIASDKLLLEMERVDLASLLEEALEVVQHAAREKGLEIRSRAESEKIVTVGDPARLKQVLWNLLTNGIKFTPQGGRLEVSLRRLGSGCEISVRDTGIGVRPEDLPRLFERFRQSDSTTTSRHGGLGLGLWISRRLVELHGGSLRASSDGPDQGATFTIELPLADEVPEAPRAAQPAALEGSPLHGLSVLVVEDEPDMREVIRVVLEEHGARVLAADHAAQALERLDEEPDILVSDIRLPGVDGYDLIRRIRQRGDRLGRIPAVALTAFARGEDRTRAMRAGFQAHLTKPFEPTELVLTLASLAEITRAGRAS